MKLGQTIKTTAKIKVIRNGEVIGTRVSKKKFVVNQGIFDLYNSEKVGRNMIKLIKALCQGGN